MILKSKHMALIILIFIIGSTTAASLLGFWKTTSDKSPAVFKEGSFAGQNNPADIRGSYTFEDISKSFDIPVQDLGIAFGVKSPSQYSSFKCKDLESLYADAAAEGKEIGTTSVRYFVSLYKGLPFDFSEGVYLPKSAVDILINKADLTQEQIKVIEEYSIEIK